MSSRRRGRFPSEEELELWAKVTRHDQPLARHRPAVPHDPATGDTGPAIPPQPIEIPADDIGAAARPAEILNGKARHSTAEPPPPQPFDPRAAKRIARGRHGIDATLDLHGMRQHDAHAALRHFLAGCQAQGHRHVLIITGKGSRAESEGSRDFWTSEDRGVLRRLVPHWLSEPSMRLHVVSFTESHFRHGGSGALYVTIRKGLRARS